MYQPRYLNGAFWEYGTFSLYALELVIWVCLLSAIPQLMVSGFSWQKLRCKHFLSPGGAVMAGAFGLVARSWLSLLWASDRALALQGAFRLTEAVALMVVLLNASSRGRLRVLAAWAVSAALQGLLATVQFFTQTVGGSTVLGVDPQFGGELGASVIELADGGRWLRAYGTFPHPNMLAGFLVLGIFCAGAWYAARFHSVQRVVALVCALLASAGLIFTFSRSGAAALASGFVVWVLSAVWRRDAMSVVRFTGLTILTAAAAAVWVAPQLDARLAGTERLERKSFVERRALLHEGLVLAERSLPFGVGIGQETVAAYQRDSGRPGFAYQPPHNVALLALVELGIDGFLVLVLFGLGAVMLAARFPAGAGMFAAVAVLGWFDHYLWTLLPGMLMAWISAGVLFGRSRND